MADGLLLLPSPPLLQPQLRPPPLLRSTGGSKDLPPCFNASRPSSTRRAARSDAAACSRAAVSSLEEGEATDAHEEGAATETVWRSCAPACACRAHAAARAACGGNRGASWSRWRAGGATPAAAPASANPSDSTRAAMRRIRAWCELWTKLTRAGGRPSGRAGGQVWSTKKSQPHFHRHFPVVPDPQGHIPATTHGVLGPD